MKIIQNFCVVFNDAEYGLGVVCLLNRIFQIAVTVSLLICMMLRMDDQQREPMAITKII